jgi:hypothetical protein
MATDTEVSQYLNADGTLDVDKLEIYSKTPNGQYVAKLVDVKVSEPGKWDDGSEKAPQLEAVYEILEGQLKGRTHKTWYDLKLYPPKQPGGKPSGIGIGNIILAIRNVGEEVTRLPIQKPLEMRKLFARHLGKKRLMLTIGERPGTGANAGKVYAFTRVDGLAGAAQTQASAADLDGDDEPATETSDELA